MIGTVSADGGADGATLALLWLLAALYCVQSGVEQRAEVLLVRCCELLAPRRALQRARHAADAASRRRHRLSCATVDLLDDFRRLPAQHKEALVFHLSHQQVRRRSGFPSIFIDKQTNSSVSSTSSFILNLFWNSTVVWWSTCTPSGNAAAASGAIYRRRCSTPRRRASSAADPAACSTARFAGRPASTLPVRAPCCAPSAGP